MGAGEEDQIARGVEIMRKVKKANGTLPRFIITKKGTVKDRLQHLFVNII